MKLRIDRVGADADGQFLIHYTTADEGEEFPVQASGLCFIFANKVAARDAILAEIDRKELRIALRDAVRAWRLASPSFANSAAAGKTSDDPS